MIALKPFTAWWVRSTVMFCALSCMLLSSWVSGSLGADPQGGHYQAYPLRHKKVAEIHGQLQDLLQNVQPPPRIIPDGLNNQILVQGNETAQKIASQFLKSVDVPAEPRHLPPSEPTVRAYRVTAGSLTDISERLKQHYADKKSVRLTTDTSTSQLIILAPPEIHAEIQRELKLRVGWSGDQPTTSGDQPTTAVPNTSGPTRTGIAVPPDDRVVQLENTSGDQIVSQLQYLLGTRIELSQNRQPNQRELVFHHADNRQVQLSLDRQNDRVRLLGDAQVVSQLVRLISALDRRSERQDTAQGTVRIVPVRRADPSKLREAIQAYRDGRSAASTIDGTTRSVPPPEHDSRVKRRLTGPIALVQMLQPEPLPAEVPASEDLTQPIPAIPDAEQADPPLRDLGDRVQIETLPDLDVIILRGRDADVDEVSRIIAEIERLSAETIPEIYVYQLRHVHCISLVSIISLVAEDLIGGRQGQIHATPLVKPNALLLIGWGEAVDAMKELIARLDQPVPPETQLRVYRLRHAPVATAAATVEDAFAEAEGLAARVFIVPDIRTNSLIVRAAPSDLAEIDLLIRRIDQGGSEMVNQARIFKLKNSLAAELATTLQSAIQAASGGAAGPKSMVLELITADMEGRQLLRSGVLDDVQITADPHTNALMVTAPAESMDLLAALIEQLDSPTAVAQIKVFNIINGDAASLIEMLRTLLPGEMTVAGPQLAGAEGETTLVPVRFSVDTRTNCIIATGSQGDLAIIEALLLRLDEGDVVERINTVYRLKNSPAVAVAESINVLLESVRTLAQAAPGIVSPYEQVEREVIVVPEPVSNSLIISATPKYYEEVLQVVEQLDAEPPQVMIQVVIAEVILDDFDELGLELGLQDSVLFDRSLLGDLEKVTTTVTGQEGGSLITTTTEQIVAATNLPGFDFNNQDLGNAGSDKAFGRSGNIGTQGLSTFGMGRMSSDLGYGGFVMSASSESVSMLVRALQQTRRAEILGRPQIMTLDNQQAFIQVGERVPRITGSRFDGRTQTNTVELENTGIILGVTPRISPEGLVVMEIDAEKSKVGSEQDGIPVSVVEDQVIRSPKIKVITAQTTVSAASGETIVLGGLITKETDVITRRVPFLSDIPVLGHLFRYDSNSMVRAELLIFLTPHVIKSKDDLERIKQAEAARMSWCLSDVHELHGPTGVYEDADTSCWSGQGEVIYPDVNPDGLMPGAFDPVPVPIENLELLPAPGELNVDESQADPAMPSTDTQPRDPPPQPAQPTAYTEPLYGPPERPRGQYWQPTDTPQGDAKEQTGR